MGFNSGFKGLNIHAVNLQKSRKIDKKKYIIIITIVGRVA